MSGKIFLTSKMEQNPSSCSIGIWNYHLALSKSKSRIFPGPYPSPMWNEIIKEAKYVSQRLNWSETGPRYF